MLEECTVCGDVCTYLDRDPDHCGECGRVVHFDQRCVAGMLECTEPGHAVCDGRCRDLLRDRDHCGSCGAFVGRHSECVDGVRQCLFSMEADCGTYCADIEETYSDCGACGRSCAAYIDGVSLPEGVSWGASPGSCTAGSCRFHLLTQGIACRDVCSVLGLTCLDDPTIECDYTYVREGRCICAE